MSEIKDKYGFETKEEMLNILRAYTETPDDDNIRFKIKIKEQLLNCPQLLYVLNEKDKELELFDEDGNLTPDGEWDLYFGDLSNIRPYLFFPDVQTDTKSYLCYQVSFTEIPRYNTTEKLCHITFTTFVYSKNNMDKITGIPRHDLIMSIVREQFVHGNTFYTKAEIVSDKESSMDNNYIVRTVVYECTLPNAIVRTKDGKTSYINKTGLRK